MKGAEARDLSSGGRMRLDRPLPYLCVARRIPRHARDDVEWLVVGEAAYLAALDVAEGADEAPPLVRELCSRAGERFGAFLVIEVWSGGAARTPRFVLRATDPAPTTTLAALQDELARIRIHDAPAEVEVSPDAPPHPPGLPPLVVPDERCRWIGVEAKAVWLDEALDHVYPIVRHELRRAFGRALRRAAYVFSREETSLAPGGLHALGRRVLEPVVWDADRELAAIERSYDFVFQMTPLNAEHAWARFREEGFRGPPPFLYRPWPVDPDLVKRRLYEIPLERVEDPMVADLLHAKRRELDLKAGMIRDRGTPRILFGNLQLYGPVDDVLLALARRILREVDPDRPGALAGAPEIAARATTEIERYRGTHPPLKSRVEVRDDFPGVMVSRGNLIVGRNARVARERLEALVHHEIGTHVLTYANGAAQPFRLLAGGLAGYESLQEGLALLAEHLAGNFTRDRLRLVAARVVAARTVEDGARFDATFALLHEEHGLPPRESFSVAMRVHRGGALLKDAIYLRGLVELLDHLRAGGALEPLYAGKIATEQIPFVEELAARGVLREPPLRPRYLDLPGAADRLERLRGSLGVTELAEAP